MGWLYDSRELKTKQDFIDQLEEIQAYAELDGQDFDFGSGLIINEMSLGSEDAYYEMDIDNLVDTIEYWEYNRHIIKKEVKVKPNRRYYKQVEKDRIRQLSDITWMCVLDNDDWLQRVYRGRRSSQLKKISNKKIRRYKGDISIKGNMCHKIFDFWWTLD